jgi:hypothetical protein
MDEASDQLASKRALLALKITAVKAFDVGFWGYSVSFRPGCWRDVLGGWIYGGGHGRGGTSKRNSKPGTLQSSDLDGLR